MFDDNDMLTRIAMRAEELVLMKAHDLRKLISSSSAQDPEALNKGEMVREVLMDEFWNKTPASLKSGMPLVLQGMADGEAYTITVARGRPR